MLSSQAAWPTQNSIRDPVIKKFMTKNKSLRSVGIALASWETANVDQANLKLRNPPAYSSTVLGLQVC